jgi:hypothetical protein
MRPNSTHATLEEEQPMNAVQTRTWFHATMGLMALGLMSFTGVPAQATGLQVNETEGFGADQLVVFTYLQNFSCIHEPFDDLNHNNKVAAIDPPEFQRPRCVVNHQPSIGPTGESIDTVENLWVLVPWFQVKPEGPESAFTPDVGALVLQLFGFVPEAVKKHPGVPVQCPEPGPPETQHKGAPGTCTMHTTHLDLGPALSAQGKLPENTAFVVPTLNHSHLIDDDNVTPPTAIWWKIISVLVTDPQAWPGAKGESGITSLAKLQASQQAGQAGPDVPTNFFLFFTSHPEAAEVGQGEGQQ